MAYKLKPKKAVSRRFRVTATGKLKHRREKNSHLRSGRTAGLKRRLGRAAVLHEGHARNMREFMGVKGKRPNQVVHERQIKESQKEGQKSEGKSQK